MITSLILFLAVYFWVLGYPAFELTLLTLLLTPILGFLLAQYAALDFSIYSFSMLTLVALFGLIRVGTRHRRSPFGQSLFPVLVFIGSFHLFLSYCLSWPDFIAIGERLRDYAILSSAIHAPLTIEEPWMAGYPLNYYAYWYRFGHFLSSCFGLHTWQVYPLLQSFTFALYFTCVFQILNRYLGISRYGALFYAVLLTLGSNLSGIAYYLSGDQNWWGPSRVVTGAINEFPAWSFLLGDLHPHYLNLALAPLLILVFLAFYGEIKRPSHVVMLLMASLVVVPLWMYNANAWEVPVWIALMSGIGTGYLVRFISTYRSTKKFSLNLEKERFEWRAFFILGLIALCTVSLYLSQKNIIPADYPISAVQDPIKRTPLSELFLHFGIPLFIISASYIALCSSATSRWMSIALLASTVLFQEGIVFLIVLAVCGVVRFAQAFGLIGDRHQHWKLPVLVIESLGMVALCLVIVPELIFLNDPYGADIERMNTIFKIYSATWFWLHLYAFSLSASLLSRYLPNFQWSFPRFKEGLSVANVRLGAIALGAIVAFTLSTGFFRFTAHSIRQQRNLTVEPFEEGLSEVDRLFPGSAATIKALRQLPRGITLEAQGRPYDYTTFIATLAEQPSYLGWANHVNLLLNNNPKVHEREVFTQNFYREKECERKRAMLNQEHISYVVVGMLEERQHPELSRNDFNCLKSVIKEGRYEVYALR